MSTESLAVGLREIEEQLRMMIDASANTYSAGQRIWETAFPLAPESPDLMWPLWLIWGSLTDHWENRPNERHLAEEEMLRAAREWLDLESDAAGRAAYLDRWVYEELGYARKPQ